MEVETGESVGACWIYSLAYTKRTGPVLNKKGENQLPRLSSELHVCCSKHTTLTLPYGYAHTYTAIHMSHTQKVLKEINEKC